MSRPVPAAAIWALGASQIVGYGTLYYSFSVLAPNFGATFGWRQEWVYAALSLSLLAGGIAAPVAGGLVDRFGAGRIMTIGSILAALGFAVAALAQSGAWFAVSLLGLEVISSLVLYAAAFAALVRIGGRDAQRSITHLTLIAGFASTLFWPLTAALIQVMDWRAVYLVFAALNLFLCAPLHWWIGTLEAPETEPAAAPNDAPTAAAAPSSGISPVFLLMMAGFAIEGFILSAVLNHIAPLLTMLGLAGPSILITTLFGPAQVLSRLVNMLFGKGMRQTHLAIIAAALPGLGVLTLALGGPSALAGMAFALLFGLGSGLTSIVSGSLPLELFGRHRYGSRLGWLSSARQIASAIAPFGLALMIASLGAVPALLAVSALAAVSTLVFAAIAIRLASGRVADARRAQSG